MQAVLTVDRRSGIPLWRQISDTLSGQIEQSLRKVGDRLPSENALAKEFGVNRHTIRQAVNVLATEGLVRIERGRGTFVQGTAIDYPLDGGCSYSQSLMAQSYSKDYEVISLGMMRADASQAAGLEVSPGDELAYIEALGKAGKRPIVYSRSFFPVHRCPDVLNRIARLKSVVEAYAEMGYKDTTRAMTRISAEMPNIEVAARLNISPTRPVMKTVKLDTTKDGRPLCFSISYFAADACQLTIDNRPARRKA